MLFNFRKLGVMSTIIPDFSVTEINSLEDYKRFRHCIRYVRQKSELITKKTELDELMRASGYSNLTKFIKHRKQWDSFQRPIPLAYLNYLKIDLNVMAAAQEVDYLEFENAKTIKLFPRYAKIRRATTYYQKYTFTDYTNEIEAIEIMQQLCDELETTALITLSGIQNYLYKTHKYQV